ncbi:uncharacterized protein KY384_001687 [Bacidia gigantensis]|uniref:uncharacterized protein n=1 Tax=Bacidia gigantensis TaxID=2732470 RepID=UPI001D05875E|nr:uncharacterized protein KY384_001687 [Bacidia gigantensis]KAG8533946.1 hypothetical protein KY384_001687 [Bacidia gigantensis]
MASAEKKGMMDAEATVKNYTPDPDSPLQRDAADAATFRDSLPRGRFGPFIASFILLAIALFLAVVVFVPVNLKKPGSLSVAGHALYVTGTTILASMVALYCTRQVRLLWVRRILYRSYDGTRWPSHHDVAEVRTLLGLGTWRESFRFWSTAGALLLVGLLTTSIVSGVSPFASGLIQAGDGVLYTKAFTPCFFRSNDASNHWYMWTLANGTVINYNTTLRNIDDISCPVEEVTDLLSASSGILKDYAYVAGGVPVSRNATGTPFSWNSGNTGFSDALGIYGTNHDKGDNSQPDYGALDSFQIATACSPVVYNNPVQCRKAGALAVNQDQIEVTADGYTFQSTLSDRIDPTKQGATAIGVATNDTQVGKATIIMGAVNSHAIRLSEVMCDTGTDFLDSGIESYTVACTVDIAPSISSRIVYYGRAQQQTVVDYFGYSFLVESDDEHCILTGDGDPISKADLITEATLAHGAAGAFHLLQENLYDDGWWNKLHLLADRRLTSVTHQLDSPVYDNSVNALEDALGLASAASLSLFWANDPHPHSPDSDVVGWDSGIANFQGTRIGPGRHWAILYVLPQLFTIALLGYLWWKTRHISKLRR